MYDLIDITNLDCIEEYEINRYVNSFTVEDTDLTTEECMLDKVLGL